jgi:phosphate-selective porin OprO/OprP
MKWMAGWWSALVLSVLCSAGVVRAQAVAEDAALKGEHAAPAKSASDAAPPAAPIDPYTLRTADGRFTLRMGAQIQFRYTASDAKSKGDRNVFNMREVRPQLKGQIGLPWITYFIQPELAGTPKLLDLELTAQPWTFAGLKIGQFLTPFSRTFYTPVPKMLFPDFSLANDYFRADRETGAMLFGTPLDGLLEYYAGVFNGNRINNVANDDNKMIYVGRVAVNPIGTISYDETPGLAGKLPLGLGIGFNAYRAEAPAKAAPLPAGSTPPTTASAMTPKGTDYNTTLGADITLRYWRATLQAEGYYRFSDPKHTATFTSRGGYIHASSFVFWPYLELAARVSYLDPNLDTPRDTTKAYEGMLNVYAFGNNLKLNLRYAHFDLPKASTSAENAFTAQVQAFL